MFRLGNKVKGARVGVRVVVSVDFSDTASPGIYSLSLRDALPIWGVGLGPIMKQVSR